MTTITDAPDLVVTDHGTIYLLEPMTDAGQEWVDENLPEDVQYMGNAVVVEHRYIEPIAYDAYGDGLVIHDGAGRVFDPD